MGIIDQRGGRAERILRGAGDHQSLVDSQRIGIVGDLRQSATRDHARIIARVASEHPVEGRTGRRHQLHQRRLREAAQQLQIACFKRLDEDRGFPALVAVTGQRCQQRSLQGQADPGKVTGMLGLRIDPDALRRRLVTGARRMRTRHIGAMGQIEDLIQCRNFELAIKACVRRPQLRDALAHRKRFSSARVKSSVNQPSMLTRR